MLFLIQNVRNRVEFLVLQLIILALLLSCISYPEENVIESVFNPAWGINLFLALRLSSPAPSSDSQNL